jgi:phage FluMu gp28-like protein
MCEFIDGSSVLLPYDLIALAESSDATEVCDPELFNAPGGHELYCGIDFGRVSDPAVCWTLERVGPLLLTKEVLVLRGVDTPDQQDILRSRIQAARRTSFDYTGPGIGLGDHLVKEHGRYDPDKHEFGKVELCTFTAPFKRLLFPRLRKTFEAPTQIRVPISIAIREDLHAMQQTIRNGEYSYHAPRTAEGHSDRCTAAALAVRAAGDGPGTTFAPRPFSSRRSAIRRSHRAALRAHHQETAA